MRASLLVALSGTASILFGMTTIARSAEPDPVLSSPAFDNFMYKERPFSKEAEKEIFSDLAEKDRLAAQYRTSNLNANYCRSHGACKEPQHTQAEYNASADTAFKFLPFSIIALHAGFETYRTSIDALCQKPYAPKYGEMCQEFAAFTAKNPTP